MSNYKRLTPKKKCTEILKEKENENVICIWQDCTFCGQPIPKLLDYLAELEDKIENGLLIEFPCKKGTTVYYIRKECWNCPENWEDLSGAYCDVGGECDNMIYGEECKKHFCIAKSVFHPSIRNCVWGTILYERDGVFDSYNCTYFLTKAEAEAKLKEILEKSVN